MGRGGARATVKQTSSSSRHRHSGPKDVQQLWREATYLTFQAPRQVAPASFRVCLSSLAFE